MLIFTQILEHVWLQGVKLSCMCAPRILFSSSFTALAVTSHPITSQFTAPGLFYLLCLFTFSTIPTLSYTSGVWRHLGTCSYEKTPRAWPCSVLRQPKSLHQWKGVKSCQEAQQDVVHESKFLLREALKVTFCFPRFTCYILFPRPCDAIVDTTQTHIPSFLQTNCCPACLCLQTANVSLLLGKYKDFHVSLTFSSYKAYVKLALWITQNRLEFDHKTWLKELHEIRSYIVCKQEKHLPAQSSYWREIINWHLCSLLLSLCNKKSNINISWKYLLFFKGKIFS